MKITKTEEQKERKQVIKDIEKKISNRVFVNLVIAIIIMAYFCGMSIVYKNIGYYSTINIVKWTTIGFLGIAIILMEIAYKKESKIWAINAFEILALAVHSLTTTHITKVYNFDFQKYILWSSYAFSIYYVLKTIIINTKARKDYLRSLSDISQIVQKDEPQKKEATKKEKIIEEEKTEKVKEHKFLSKKTKNKEAINSEKEEKTVEADKEKETKEVKSKEKESIELNKTKEKEQKNNPENEEESSNTEKRRATRNKKLAGLLEKLEKMDSTNDNSKEIKKEEQTKKEPKQEIEETDNKEEIVEEKKENKKTATKKTTTAKKTTTKTTSKSKEPASKEENVDTENKPKKRGRPKKEVKVDD